MPDLSAYGFSLIPGPPEIPDSFSSTQVSFITEYPFDEVAAAFDALFTPLPVKNASDPESRTWEWREGERFAVIGFSTMDSVEEPGLEIWGGSRLELSCTLEDLLRLWTAVRERFSAVWLHDGACRMYRPETFLDVLRASRGPASATSVFAAIQAGRTWDLESLLQEDRGLAHAADASGRSALQLAVMHLDMLQLLLAAGADPNTRDESGTTPLLLAARLVQAAAVERLLAAGANPNAQDAEGRTPLHHAVQRGRDDVARLLLAGGADPHLADRRGESAHALASKQGTPELLAARRA